MFRLIILIGALFINILAFGEDVEEQRASYQILTRGQLWEKDYFAIANGIEISGEVKQDAYLIGSQVVVDGVVDGDVLVMGGTIEIAGVVHGNVRAVAAEVIVSGSIGKSLSVCAGNVHIGSAAKIDGGVVLVSGNADLAGTLNNNATIAASNIRFASHIKGNVTAFAGQLRLTSRAIIGGKVDYSSSNDIWVEKEAQIAQGVHRNSNNFQILFKQRWLDMALLGSRVAGFLMNVIYTFAIGCVLIKIYPNNLQATTALLRKHPLKAFFNGIVIAILVPLVSLLLLMTILGVPFALTLIAANIIGFYTAKVYVIYWLSEGVSDKLNLKKRRLLIYTFGVFVYFILLAVPYLGFVLSLASMLTGLGAMVSIQVHKKLLEKHPHP